MGIDAELNAGEIESRIEAEVAAQVEARIEAQVLAPMMAAFEQAIAGQRASLRAVIGEIVGQAVASTIEQVKVQSAAVAAAALEAAPTNDGGGSEALRASLQAIYDALTQADILKALLDGVEKISGSCGLLVMRGSVASGYQARKVASMDVFREISLDVAESPLAKTIQQNIPLHGPAESLLPQVAAADATMWVVPLAVRDKVVALVFAQGENIDGAALQVMSRAAGMWLEIVSARRAAGAPAPAPSAVESNAAHAVAAGGGLVAAPEPAKVVDAVAVEQSPARTRAVEVEGGTAATFSADELAAAAEQAAAGPDTGATPVDAVARTSAPTGNDEDNAAASESTTVEAVAPSEVAKVMSAAASATASVAAPVPVVESAAAAQPAAPASVNGAAIPAGDEDLHKKARRFAKLLADEIKLYNPAKVNEGREKKDIYTRLREDIDKSRETYSKRYANTSVARAGYFEDEVVRILASGDESAMGAGFRR